MAVFAGEAEGAIADEAIAAGGCFLAVALPADDLPVRPVQGEARLVVIEACRGGLEGFGVVAGLAGLAVELILMRIVVAVTTQAIGGKVSVHRPVFAGRPMAGGADHIDVRSGEREAGLIVVECLAERPAVGGVAFRARRHPRRVVELRAVRVIGSVAGLAFEIGKTEGGRFFLGVMAGDAGRGEVRACQHEAGLAVVAVEVVGDGRPGVLCVAVGAIRPAVSLLEDLLVRIDVARLAIVHLNLWIRMPFSPPEKRQLDGRIAAGRPGVAGGAVQTRVLPDEVEPRCCVVEAVFVKVADLLPGGGVVAVRTVRPENPAVRIVMAGRAVGEIKILVAREGVPIRCSSLRVAISAFYLPVSAYQFEPGVVVVETLSLFPSIFRVTRRAIFAHKLTRVRAFRFVATQTARAQTEESLAQGSVAAFEGSHLGISDVSRTVTRPARDLLVGTGKPKAGLLVVEARRVESDELKRRAEVFFVTVGTVLLGHRSVEAASGIEARFERRVAIQAQRVVDALVTEAVAGRAVANAVQILMRLREFARRDELGLHRRGAECESGEENEKMPSQSR